MGYNRNNPKNGKRKVIVNKDFNAFDKIRKLLILNHIAASDAQIVDFENWMIVELWQKYNNHYLEIQNKAIKSMDSAPIIISNGTKGKPYRSQIIILPTDICCDFEFEGLEGTGLEIEMVENGFYIHGVPAEIGDVSFTIKSKFDGWVEGQPMPERTVCFTINPDPRTLWRNIPTSEDVPYYKPDTECAYVNVEDEPGDKNRKDIVAASNRGRSHAQEGKARDDHFKVYHSQDSDWYILAVADGAGSAKFSRKGSEIACATVMDYCIKQLENNTDFESAICAYNDEKNNPENEASVRKAVGDYVYKIVGNAAYSAHKEINRVAALSEDTRPKDFATTLLLAICKKFDFGWFIGSFWVGDGAMCLYDKDSQSFALLGTPDEGEFSGQTRFLTMPEIFSDSRALYQRLRFGIKDEFTALFLMTDGVSDPMFGTDANLNSIGQWNELWDKLQNGFPEDEIPGVDFSAGNVESKDQLLNWLNFWVPGEHDDRTIAILY